MRLACHPALTVARSGARALACLLLLVLLAGSAQAAWQGRERVVDGVLHVENPAVAMHPAVTLELEELWRLGGDSEEEGEFFGVICDVVVDDTGEVYLLDRQLAEIKVFSAAGEYLRSIGREGEGPGEFRRPVGLFFLPDGQLAVIQQRPSRLVLLNRDGLPGENFTLPEPDDGGLRSLSSGACRGGSLVLSGISPRFEEGRIERSRRMIGVNLQGEPVALYDEQMSVLNMAKPVIRETEGFFFPWTLLPDGMVVASLDFDYRLQLWQADGSPDRVIVREHEPYLRSKEELAEERQQLESSVRFRGRRRAPKPDVEVSDHERGVSWLAADEGGHIWVLPGRSVKEAPAGILGTFDVFDSRGRYLQAVTLAGEGDFEQDRVILTAGRLYVLTQYTSALTSMFGRESEEEEQEELEEAEPMSVICYRLDWIPPTTLQGDD